MNIIPCISLWQPWATWVMNGWKPTETRTHTRFRKLSVPELGIHASGKYDNEAHSLASPYLTKKQLASTKKGLVEQGKVLWYVKSDYIGKLNRRHSKGACIDCERTTRYGLSMSNPRNLLTPVPCKGSQGLWYFNKATGKKATKKQYLAQFHNQ